VTGLRQRKRVWFPALLALSIGIALMPLAVRSGEPAPHAATAREAEQLVARIAAGRDVGAALCRLIALKRYYRTPRYEPDACSSLTVRHFIASPQADRTVYAAIIESDLVDDPQVPHAGLLTLFDSHGFIIPVFAGANLLESADAVLAYQGDQRRAIAHVINTSAGDDTVQVLHVVPMADPQQSVLTVIVGPPAIEVCEGYSWSWRARDVDGDGIDDIEIGPLVDQAGGIDPRATYHWSGDEGRYVGPAGSPADGFLRTDLLPGHDECCGHHTREFAEERLRLGLLVPADAIRRPVCDEITWSTPSATPTGSGTTR
jgi:hypothetical protein